MKTCEAGHSAPVELYVDPNRYLTSDKKCDIMVTMTIECACGCGEKLSDDDGHYRKRRFVNGHNGRKYKDPTQFKREWNHRNRPARFKWKMDYHRKRKVQAMDYKGSECLDCAIKYNGKNAAIFHFHHLRDKKFNVGNQLVNKAWDIIKVELDKCVMLCANCHEMRHSREF